jgi:hypothetical protein
MSDVHLPPQGSTSAAVSAPVALGAPRPEPAAPERAGPLVREVVPVRGLPVVGVVLGLLVAAIATNTLWGLDFFHVVGGGLWTALDLFLGFVLGPILGRLSIPARMELTARLMPKMVLIMPTLVTMTLGAGFQLARHLGNLASSSPNHPWLVASYVVVGVMAVVAIGILEPANLAVLFELRRPEPRGEVIGTLMRRFIYTAGVTGAMQIATLVIMTHVAAS